LNVSINYIKSNWWNWSLERNDLGNIPVKTLKKSSKKNEIQAKLNWIECTLVCNWIRCMGSYMVTLRSRNFQKSWTFRNQGKHDWS